MLILNLFEELEGPPEPTLIDTLRDFLPLAIKHLELKKLPKIKLLDEVETEHMPSFGKFSNDDSTIHLGIKNRHPNDILRTLAHEMVHYAQGQRDELGADSGATGSPEEDQANAEAGVIMREFNQQFPQYMELKPIMLEKWSKKYKKSINCSNPKGFSQKAHCAGRKKKNKVKEGFLSNFKKRMNIAATKSDFKSAKYHIDWLINKAKSNNINGLDAVTRLGWYSIWESVAHTKDQKLDQLFKEIWMDLEHWPKNNTDVQRSKHLIDQLTILRKNLEIASQNIAENFAEGCPLATQDIALNLKNRQKAIDEYHYGPLNPNLPNNEYWAELADKWNTTDIDSVKQNRCGNCGAFDVSKDMQACIAKGIGSEPGSSAMDAVDAGQLGYCKFLKFKCASKRTCDAWIEGGPITEQSNQLDENQEKYIIYLNDKPVSTYPTNREAEYQAKIIIQKFPTAKIDIKKEVCTLSPVQLEENLQSIKEGKHCDAKNAVPELKAALTKRKTELKNASAKTAYDKIDKIMTRIAQTYNISGQKLHDLWTERYGEIPDTWVLGENFADPNKLNILQKLVKKHKLDHFIYDKWHASVSISEFLEWVESWDEVPDFWDFADELTKLLIISKIDRWTGVRFDEDQLPFYNDLIKYKFLQNKVNENFADGEVEEGLGNWLKNKFDPNNIPGFTDIYNKIKPYVVKDIINKIPKDKFGAPTMGFGFWAIASFEMGEHDDAIKDSVENFLIQTLGKEQAYRFVQNKKLINAIVTQLQVDIGGELINFKKKYTEKGVAENFADGKGPGRAGDSQRHGIPKGATMAELETAAKASGRKGQLARWQINMRRGKKK